MPDAFICDYIRTPIGRYGVTGGRYALAAMCIGLGQWIAVALERV